MDRGASTKRERRRMRAIGGGGDRESGIGHGTAQHSTAQHSTAQHTSTYVHKVTAGGGYFYPTARAAEPPPSGTGWQCSAL